LGAVGGLIPGPAGAIARTAGSLLRGGGQRIGMEDVIRRQPIPVFEDVVGLKGPGIRRGAETLPGLPNLSFQETNGRRVIKKPGLEGLIERVLPFGETGFIVENGSLPMIGPFGVAPGVKEVAVRVCPTGMRLGIDGLCYPKQLLAARSKLRAWPAEMKPPITNRDRRVVNTFDAVQTKLKKMGKKAGLKVTG